jgi:hypothetical protein
MLATASGSADCPPCQRQVLAVFELLAKSPSIYAAANNTTIRGVLFQNSNGGKFLTLLNIGSRFQCSSVTGDQSLSNKNAACLNISVPAAWFTVACAGSFPQNC